MLAAAVLCLGVLLVQVGGQGAASAHSYLVTASPQEGEQVAVAPDAAVLTFNQPVKTALSAVQVVGPDGGAWQDGSPQVSGATLTQPLSELGPAGTYQVRWRVVSADGHPISGAVSFTLTTAGTGTAVQPAAAPASTTGGGGSSWPLVAGGLALLAVLLAAAAGLAVRRARPVPGRT